MTPAAPTVPSVQLHRALSTSPSPSMQALNSPGTTGSQSLTGPSVSDGPVGELSEVEPDDPADSDSDADPEAEPAEELCALSLSPCEDSEPAGLVLGDPDAFSVSEDDPALPPESLEPSLASAQAITRGSARA